MHGKDLAIIVFVVFVVFSGVCLGLALDPEKTRVCPIKPEYREPLAWTIGTLVYLIVAAFAVRWTAPKDFDTVNRLMLLLLFPLYAAVGILFLLVYPFARIVGPPEYSYDRGNADAPGGRRRG